MVGMAFAIAASANFPILFLSLYWKNLTSKGAFYGGFIGLLTAAILVILGPIVWVDILGNANPIFSLQVSGTIFNNCSFYFDFFIFKN